MKTRIEKLEKEIERNNEELARHDVEIITLREFKHVTNGTLHSHNGKLDTIAIQQNGIVSELALIRQDLKEWAAKTTALMTIKSMAIGAGLIIPPVVGTCWFVFQWYMKSLGME